MKNKSKNTKKERAKCTRLIVTYALITYAIFASGCNKPLQTTIPRPHTVPAGNLIPGATRIIQEALADENPLIRVNAIEAVAVTKQIKLMPKVRRLLKDEFVPVRFVAILAVGDLEYHLAESPIRKLLNDENENIRIAAAYALTKLGSADSLKLFRNAIVSNDQTVRANAALLLGKSGDKSDLTRQALWWTLGRKDSTDKVIFQTVEAIAMLGDERIIPKVWPMLISKFADVRVIGIRAMGALGTPEAKDALITMLDDDILEVRLAAAEQLGMLKDTIGEPEVLDVFKKNLTAGLDKKGLERVNVRTALAIGQIGTPRLIKFLPRFLKDESKSVRIAAAMAVFQCITQ
ncbi:MAG: HEAT repeat domain-containing protein [Planctomycetota bacterium]